MKISYRVESRNDFLTRCGVKLNKIGWRYLPEDDHLTLEQARKRKEYCKSFGSNISYRIVKRTVTEKVII